MVSVRRVGIGVLAAAVASGLLVAGLPAASADPTPSPSDTASASPSDSASTTASPTATATPSVTASATPTPTATPTETAVPATTTTTPATPAETAVPVPAPTDTPAPAAVFPPPVTAMPAALGSWCEALFPPGGAAAEKKAAQALLAGKADMGAGGTYTLSAHPNWKPQAGTDTSGDRHVHSLNWALPLLYRGVHKQVHSMVQRFSDLMHYWIADNKGKRGTWVNASIYGGLRTQTLVCAAQTLNDPVIAQAALEDANRMLGALNYGPGSTATGRNNTDLIRQTGALAARCWVNDSLGAQRAWRNLNAVARGVVQPDGSDIEGSPWYAVYIEKLLRVGERSASTCGIDPSSLGTLRSSIVDFVAQAVRPDFKLESLGDSIARTLPKDFSAGDARSMWVRSAGASGTPSQPIYSTFLGGYAFGRAGWQPQLGMADTFYSMRFSSSRPATAHAHDDGGALTLYSRGVQWISDPGPYRYENSSSLRWYMKSRAAHSSVSITGAKRLGTHRTALATGRSDWQTGGNDLTCTVDTSYQKVQVKRCVQYIRSVDAVVVTDEVTARKGKKGRQFVQRWQLQPGMSGSVNGQTLTLANGRARLDVLKAGPGNWAVEVAKKGSSVGWQTGKWGEKLPSAVLKRSGKLPKKASTLRYVTVFVPRVDGESVPVELTPTDVTITRGATRITTPLP